MKGERPCTRPKERARLRRVGCGPLTRVASVGLARNQLTGGAECLCEEHPQCPVAGVREVAARKEARYRS